MAPVQFLLRPSRLGHQPRNFHALDGDGASCHLEGVGGAVPMAGSVPMAAGSVPMAARSVPMAGSFDCGLHT